MAKSTIFIILFIAPQTIINYTENRMASEKYI